MQPNEKRLVIACVSIATVLGLLLLTQQLIQWQKRLDRQERQIELMQLEADTLLADAPLWHERSDWLSQTQPVASDELEANKELDHIVGLARQEGLTILSQQLQEPVRNDHYLQIGVSLSVKGELSALFRWMHILLVPTEFRFAPVLKVTPDKQDPTMVVAQIQFWRRYAPTFASHSNATSQTQ